MRFPARIGVFLLLAAAVSLSACGADVPANPTWANDVRPLMVARCIRCHSDPGGVDPLVTNPNVVMNSPPPALYDFNYENFSDIPTNTQSILSQVGMYVSNKSSPLFMPPAPAAPLQDWQIQTLENWAQHEQ
jgi:hypothetical protein